MSQQHAQTPLESTYLGVLLSIYKQGIVLAGKPACGKSTLALELISRGHRLIADDVILLQHNAMQTIGKCPPLLQNLLHVRELGVLNIAQLFGKKAIEKQISIKLIIRFCTTVNEVTTQQYLTGHSQTNQDIPCINLTHAAWQYSVVFIETLIKNHFAIRTKRQNDGWNLVQQRLRQTLDTQSTTCFTTNGLEHHKSVLSHVKDGCINMHIVVITGLSGSGKSTALNALEDMNFYCIDNLPADLLKALLATDSMQQHNKIAIGIDIRTHAQSPLKISETLDHLRQTGTRLDIVFLTADTSVLLKRYSETRRSHPLSSQNLGLEEAIIRERELLADLTSQANLLLDTSQNSIHELTRLIQERVEHSHKRQFSLAFQSFGFKYGLPLDSDFVFDVRCLPNPYWHVELRHKSGLESEVQTFMETHEESRNMVTQLITFLDTWIPQFHNSSRSYITISIGCTGGMHRSVFITEKLAEHFSQHYGDCLIKRHRELARTL